MKSLNMYLYENITNWIKDFDSGLYFSSSYNNNRPIILGYGYVNVYEYLHD
jgi:hypothetical protein